MKAHVSDELDYKFKFQETVAEQDEAENTPAMTVEEARKLYEEAKTARDKALLLRQLTPISFGDGNLL